MGIQKLSDLAIFILWIFQIVIAMSHKLFFWLKMGCDKSYYNEPVKSLAERNTSIKNTWKDVDV
jgi:hypothetical protein